MNCENYFKISRNISTSSPTIPSQIFFYIYIYESKITFNIHLYYVKIFIFEKKLCYNLISDKLKNVYITILK